MMRSSNLQLVDHAERVVAGWPAPTQEQLQRVAAILLTATSQESRIPEPGGVRADAA
jgi:hypothetical protein